MTHAAQLRTARILASVIGAAGLLYALLSWEPLRAQWDNAPAWWTIGAGVGTFGVPILVGALSWFLPLRALRGALLGYGVLYLLLVASAIVVVRDLPPDSAPWIVTLLAIGPASIAAAIPRGWVGVAVLVAVVELVAVRSVAAGTPFLTAAYEDAIFSTPVCAIFVALAVVVGRQAERLDRQAATAERRSGARAAAEARLAERDRVDALLHDTVLSALLFASRATEAVAPDVRRQAREALAALDATIDPGREPGSVAASEFADLLRARLVPVASGVPVRETAPVPVGAASPVAGEPGQADAPDGSPEASLRIPASIADALVAAVLEAVRNAQRHAGPRTRQTVEVTPRGDRIRVEVRDDGRGFELHAIDPSRLGVRRSILGRVRALPGGRAEITTAPGAGTIVVLEWVAP